MPNRVATISNSLPTIAALCCSISLSCFTGCSDDPDFVVPEEIPQFAPEQKDLAETIVVEHEGVTIGPMLQIAGQAAKPEKPGAMVSYSSPEEITEEFRDDIVEFNEIRPVVAFRFTTPRLSASDLELLRELDDLTYLEIDGTELDEEVIDILAELSELKQLVISRSPNGDELLGPLAQLTQLESITLASTEITGIGFKQFQQPSLLKSLSVHASPVTDEGLEAISQIKSLESLVLIGTKITDKSVPHLKKMRKLTYLNLQDTEVSKNGFRSLRKALPKARIFH